MFNDNNKGPLMYINSVQSENKLETGQKVYDSRKPNKISGNEKVQREIKLTEIELRKLVNITMLYQKEIPVTCSIKCTDETIEGIPKTITDENLTIVSGNKEIVIPLWEIVDYMILNF